MGEEFQGGVCGGTWWNSPHNLFSGGLSSPCSVAQLGGGGGANFDMGSFGWPNEAVIKGGINKCTNQNNNTNQVFDSLIFQDQMDSSSLDILGFGLSPTSSTTDWNHQSLICNSGSNEGNFDSFLQDNLNDSRLLSSYSMLANSPSMMNTSNLLNSNHNNTSQEASPPMALTASSNSSGDSSTVTCEGGLSTSFPMSSSASYLIQSLFDDSDDQCNHNEFINNNNPSSFGCSMDSSSEIMSSNSWVKTSSVDQNYHHRQLLPQLQSIQSNKFDGGMNAMINNSHGQILTGQYSPTTVNSIKTSLLNSLQSRARSTNNNSFNQKSSHSCATSLPNKMKGEELHRDQSKSNTSNNDQPQAKRPRIETPSSLPTFKVRKEKLGDRITALQQLVSPFGKTDTASVLHEAIEYIKFLHDQVHVLSTPYLKSGAAMQQQQQESEKSKDNEESKQDLKGRGLCLVPISSTYPVAQETPVDFWTPTFGGTTFR